VQEEQQHQQQQHQSKSTMKNARSRSESISSTTTAPPPPPQRPQRYLEMLVHNVAHTDLVLSLAPLSSPSSNVSPTATPRKTNTTTNGVLDDDKCLCRPRFSTFDMFGRRVLQMLQKHYPHSTSSSSYLTSPEKKITTTTKQQQQQQQQGKALESIVINYPRYERNVFSPRFSIVAPTRNKSSGKPVILPAGFDLTPLHYTSSSSPTTVTTEKDEEENLLKIDPHELPSLRVRGRDVPKLGNVCEEMMHQHLFDGNNNRISRNHASKASTPNEIHGKKEDEYDEEKKGECESSNDLYLNAIFFPLLATLLPRWTNQIEEKYNSLSISSHQIKKIVILCSGVGTPRNWTHSITGNSTQALAELMEMFITALYPDVTVVRVHSDTNIFRYDENISFVKRELMPVIDAYRDAHARNEAYPDEKEEIQLLEDTEMVVVDSNRRRRRRNPFDPDWKKSFAVTLSFADGSPARTHAIQASLRPYKPTYFHFWQLKTFWHESKICDDDIEVHSFEDMETVPAMEVNQTNEKVQLVVEEMKKFHAHFLEALKEDEEEGLSIDGGGVSKNDIRQFWLRKTKKPVLAVLLVEKQYDVNGGVGKPILYRGTNMEVSMPTGSLCAERNVIGTALASDPSLKREDLKMVAVLAVPLSPPPPSPGGGGGGNVPLCQPCGSSDASTVEIRHGGGELAIPVAAPTSATEGHAFLTEVEQKLEQSRQQQSGNMRRSLSVTSFASIVECVNEDQEEREEEGRQGAVIIAEGSNTGDVDLSSSWVVNDGIDADPISDQQQIQCTQEEKEEGGESSLFSSLSSNIITVPKSPKFSPLLTYGADYPSSVVPPLNLSQVPSSHVAAATAAAASISNASPKQPGTPMRTIKLYTDDDAGSVVAEDDFLKMGKQVRSKITSDVYGISGTDAGKSGLIGKPPIGQGRRKQKRTVVVHSSTEDLNPLRPCGACNEWLKKIAEVSIDFKVLTFTDADCNGVYVSSCQD